MAAPRSSDHLYLGTISGTSVDGLDLARLQPVIDVAVAHFELHQALKNDLAAATQKLSDRKLIDRAKGILMKSRSLEEVRE